MPTAITKGDIFETKGIHAYAFGANIDGTMDAGIAIAMKKRWPELAAAFAARCEGGKLTLGDAFMWTSTPEATGATPEQPLTVFALAIRNGEKKASMSALTHAVRRMLALAAEAKLKRIGLPRIGGGPDGLDWTRVRKMLGEISVG
ncbi:MAG: hypothetical protein RL701_1019, partial [Pseudomonadota bacterium]